MTGDTLSTADAVLSSYQAALLALTRGDQAGAHAHVLRVLEHDPEHGDSHYLLGRLRKNAGDVNGAISAYSDCARVSPDNPNVYISLGIALKSVGRLDEALLHLRRAVALQPQSAVAQLNLGNVLHGLDLPDEAIVAYVHALGVNPRQPEAHNNLGILLRGRGDVSRAIAHFNAAITLNPRYAMALVNRADAFFDCFDYAKAAADYRLALVEDPSLRHAALRLGAALTELNQLTDAEGILRHALAMQPDDPQALVSLGYIHFKRKDYELAEHCHRQALILDPQFAMAHWHLGSVLWQWGRIDEAAAEYETASIALPEEMELRMALSTLLLLRQDFNRGWPLYEARYHRSRRHPVALPDYRYPRWNGESLAGKHVLLVGEQGLGDEIMFASIIGEVLAEAEHCTITCLPQMQALLCRAYPAARVIAVSRVGAQAGAAPEAQLANGVPIDCWLPMGSLGLLRRNRRESFPIAAPYLVAESARVELWRARLQALGTGCYIGLSWRGGTELTHSARRSMPLAHLVRSLNGPERIFVNLQYGECRAEIDQVIRETGVRVVHWQEALDDFDHTAALVSALDRIVSVCTAVIHLSGALGKRVDVLAPFLPEWRYGIRGEKMPWYADVRIHRQIQLDDWSAPLTAVAEALGHSRSGRIDSETRDLAYSIEGEHADQHTSVGEHAK